jgi:hypothetical protein
MKQTCFLAAALATMLVPIAIAQRPPEADVTIENRQLNAVIALEATQNLNTYLSLNLGGNVAGTWSGNVNKKGWNVSFTGTVNGQAATITESGSLEAQTATWTDSGIVGANSISGNGTATVSGSNVSWNQAAELKANALEVRMDGFFGKLKLIAEQALTCLVSGKNLKVCAAVALMSLEQFSFGHINQRYVVTSELAENINPGVVFGSSVQESSLQTTISEGSLSRSSGDISYSVFTL